MAELRQRGVDAELGTVRNAGHHLYLDNAEDLHDHVNTWLRRVREHRKVAISSNTAATPYAAGLSNTESAVVKDA